MSGKITTLLYFIVIQSLFNVCNGAEVSDNEYKNIVMEIKESLVKEMKDDVDKRIYLATNKLKNDFIKLAEKVNQIEIKVSQIMEIAFEDKVTLTNPHTDTKNVIEPKAKLNNTNELEDRVEILELEVSFLQTALDGVAGEVDDLEADQTSQDNRMNNLEGEVNELEDELNSLEAGYVDLLMRVDTAEEDIILHREQINVLDNQDDLFDEELALLDGRVTQLEGFNQDNTQRLDDLDNLVNAGTPIVKNEGHTNLAAYIAREWCYTEVRARLVAICHLASTALSRCMVLPDSNHTSENCYPTH